MKLEDIRFVQSKGDPCLMYWKSNLGIVYVTIYVDNCYCVSHHATIEKLTEQLQQQTKRVEKFEITITDNTSDYLSCEIVFSPLMERERGSDSHT